MSALSTAVNLDRVSAITGYAIEGSLENVRAGNLLQRIAVLAEANAANQVGLPTKLNFAIDKEVGDNLGYGSPAHIISRILRPLSGDKLGGIPTLIYPVEEADGATATVITIGITGTATKNKTHKIVLSGRDQIDGDSYSFVVEKNDGAAEISQKMIDAVNNILGAPAIGTVVADDAVFTSKWKGVTSKEMNISIDVQGDSAGITYSEESKVDGAGLPDISDALAEFGEEWNTLVINGIGSDSTILDALEAFNGNVNDKTGRYEPTIFKPFISLFGDNSIDTLTEATSLTGTRKNEMTNVFCPAMNSKGFSFEAPANIAFNYAKTAQDTPATDPIYDLYPDMPTAESIGDFANSTKRDQIVKVGSSTAKLNSGSYQILDLVTTYHPDNEPQTSVLFRWVRDLIVDWNVKYKYTLLENIYVKGKIIVNDNAVVTAPGTISPKRWKGILISELFPALVDEALAADLNFMKETLQVKIGESNPNRFETTFKSKRTGIARVLSTTQTVTFNFGG